MALRLRKEHLAAIQRQRNPEGDRVHSVRLDKNERTVPFPSAVWDEMIASFNPELICVYPEVNPLLAAVAAALASGLTAKNVYLTAGSDLAIKSCFEAFVTPGSEIAFVAPTFAMVDVYCRLFDAVPTRTPTVGEDLSVDLDALLASITESTSLAFVANPNSPAGTVFSLEDVEKIAAHCERLGCPLLIDEAYYLFHPETAVDLVNRYSCLLVCRTFSKALGLAGIRLGYLVGQESTIETVSKWRPMYEVNTFAVHCGQYVLDRPALAADYVASVNTAKDLVYTWGERKSVRVYRSAANFVNVRVGNTFVRPIVLACERERLIVRGAGPAVLNDECVRISLGTPEQATRVLGVMDAILDQIGSHHG